MEQFEQLLTCAICLDRYRNPKLLPCQHSFCMEPCMDGLVDYVRRQVKCPECRAEHRIPYQGVQAFPTNVTLQRFLELHIEITGELPDPTSGQTMERCGVCSEKSYCSLCVHCDKKCCPECKDAHMDILRREITRINSQIRRGLHRLQDALALAEKNTLGLQTNCASVAEEVDEIYRRLSKALKDRTEHLRNEIERYSGTEIRGLIQLKENLELEIANIQSNCDLADAHINENVPWDDAELLDTKELFLRTVEFIRNFEYEAGDYGRRVRFVMAHDPNQLVLHVAGYGELNIKPEPNSSGHLGTTGGLAPSGGSPGLMRSKSDHRLASQYRQQEEERSTRNRYVPDYEYDTAEYETPRNKSRYRSRFMRHRDGDESDGDSRSTVRFMSASTAEQSPRERVLDTEDAARGPLSGIFRLTDSPRVMKKLQECERAGKRKKEEPPPSSQPPAPKPQVQVRKTSTPVSKQTSEDDEISKIKKQNKNTPAQSETLEERQPIPVVTPLHTTPTHEPEHDAEDLARRTSVTRRSSSDKRTAGVRSASSDSSTGSESSTGSGIRNTGAPFSAEEMKQKYLSRAPPPVITTTAVTSSTNASTANARDTASVTPTSSPRPPFQSRFLGGGSRIMPPTPSPVVLEETTKKKKDENVNEDDDDDDDDDETTSSSEETETESEEESDTETHPTPSTVTSTAQERTREAAMARTDIGPLLARSAEARRGSKEDSPSTRYSSPRGSPAHSASSPTSTTPSSYTSRFVAIAHDKHKLTTSDSVNTLMDNDVRSRIVISESDEISPTISVNDHCSMSVAILASDDQRLLDNDIDDNGNNFSTNIEIPNIVIDLDTDVNNEQTFTTNKENHISNAVLNDDKITDSNERDDTTRPINVEHIELVDDKINDFVTSIVRDYNRSREGFERDIQFGSDGEQREICNDSLSDELEAQTIERNNQNCFVDGQEKHERILTSIIEESNEIEDDGFGIESIESRKQKHEAVVNHLISHTDLRMGEEEQEVGVENLSEILSSVVESARLVEIEYLRTQGATRNNITEWRGDILKNSPSVNNLFDDQGWVVTDADLCDAHEIVSPSIPHSSMIYSYENMADGKTDYSTSDDDNIRSNPDINDNGPITNLVSEKNDIGDDDSRNGISNGELCLNSGEVANWLDSVSEFADIVNIRVSQMSDIELSGRDISNINQDSVAKDIESISINKNNLNTISDDGVPCNFEIVTTPSSSSSPESSQSSLLNWNIDINNQTATLNSANSSHNIETIIDQDNGRSIRESVWFIADALEGNSEIVLSSNKLMKDSKNLLGNSEANGINSKSEVGDYVSGDDDHSWSILGEINGDNASSYGSYEIQNDFATTDESNSNTKHENEKAIMRDFDENHDSDGKHPTTIPMQMVTTVVCVSVLCYGVLTNLFL